MFTRLERHQKASLALVVTSVIWGIAPPVIKYTLNIISTETFLFYRFLITCLVFLPLLISSIKHEKITPKKLFRYGYLGFLSVPVNLLLLFWGIKLTTANDSTLISIVSPVLIILGGAIFLHETVTKRERIGIVIVIIGTLLTIVQPLFETNLIAGGNFKGNFLVFSGTLAGAIFALLYKKRANRDLKPMTLTVISFWVGLLTIAPLFFRQNPLLLPPLEAVPGILFMSIFSSAIAYLTFNYGLSQIEASEASLYTYLQPIIAVPLAVIFLKETITFIFVAGSVLILSGLFIAETKKDNPT